MTLSGLSQHPVPGQNMLQLAGMEVFKSTRGTSFDKVSNRFRVTQSVNLRLWQQRGNPAELSHVTQLLHWANDVATARDAALPPAR